MTSPVSPKSNLKKAVTGGVQIYPGKMKVECECGGSTDFEIVTVIKNPEILQATGGKVDSSGAGMMQGYRCVHCQKVQMLDELVAKMKNQQKKLIQSP